MITQIETIAQEYKDYKGTNTFTPYELYTYIHTKLRPLILEYVSTADYPNWQINYIHSVLHNLTKAKKPKVTRQKINGIYHYTVLTLN